MKYVLIIVLCFGISACGSKNGPQSGDRVGEQSVPEQAPPESGPVNALMVISPYRHNGMWVFDDAIKGLVKEPLVAGVDVIIDHAVRDIPNAHSGFNLLFSANPFPGSQLKFDRQEPESGGYWYYNELTGRRGWLCPALFKYFEEAPPNIYAQFMAR